MLYEMVQKKWSKLKPKPTKRQIISLTKLLGF